MVLNGGCAKNIYEHKCRHYTGCLKIREGDYFSSPNMEIKKKSGLPQQRYIGLKAHSLNYVFFKYRRKSSVFVVIYGVLSRPSKSERFFFIV
jgi:hypothetical protein